MDVPSFKIGSTVSFNQSINQILRNKPNQETGATKAMAWHKNKQTKCPFFARELVILMTVKLLLHPTIRAYTRKYAANTV